MDYSPDVMDCTRSECLVEFAELAFGDGTSDDGIGVDSADCMHAQHCQRPGCHEIYIRGKNGWDCESCDVRFCEGCSCDHFVEIDDRQLCQECAEDHENELANM